MVVTIKILDLGCGNNKIKNAIGVDINKTSNADLIADLNFPLPFRNNSTDMVFAREVLEHLQFPKEFLQECYRILKSNGELMMTTPNRNSWVNKIFKTYFHIGKNYQYLKHKKLFSSDELENLLLEIGFCNLDVKFNPFDSAKHPETNLFRSIIHYIVPNQLKEDIVIRCRKSSSIRQRNRRDRI